MTARELDWELLANGNLLREANRLGFDVLVTCDSDFQAYKGRKDRKIAILYLNTNHRPSIVAHRDHILRTLEGIGVAGFEEIAVPPLPRRRRVPPHGSEGMSSNE